MADPATAMLARGQERLAAGEWARAREAFEAALVEGETPEAQLGLGTALWWLGETQAGARLQERAYAAFRERGDAPAAALAAVNLYFVHRVSLGRIAVARGWLGRLARLVEQADLAPLEGWVLLLRAHASDDPAAAERWAQEAHELAGRFGDADLELCAVSQRGAALLEQGQPEEGTALLDEALAGALGGEASRPDTVVFASCNMVVCCSRSDVRRATEWLRAVEDHRRRGHESAHLFAVCRAHYGALLLATGRWEEAEREVAVALRAGRTAEPAVHGEARTTLAELRLAQGRVEDAARVLDGLEDHACAACARAALQLARAQPADAAATIDRRLRALAAGEADGVTAYRAGDAVALERATLLELRAQAEIAQGDGGRALGTARELERLAARQSCAAVTARSRRALGWALAVTGERDAALAQLEPAWTAFASLELPLEAARTRLLLARTLGSADRKAALAAARAAFGGFEALGAVRDADEAAAFLRDLGVKAARTPRRGDGGALTPREREVLALLAEGLSNPEIAARLVVSRKTVEHHVAHVLAKLGVRSRAEAAAVAARAAVVAPGEQGRPGRR